LIQGLNTDITLSGYTYHIQTELVGSRIVSLIFQNGAVIADKQTLLSEEESKPGTIEDMKSLRIYMRQQHNDMIERLKGGNALPHSEMPVTEDKDLITKFLEEWASE